MYNFLCKTTQLIYTYYRKKINSADEQKKEKEKKKSCLQHYALRQSKYIWYINFMCFSYICVHTYTHTHTLFTKWILWYCFMSFFLPVKNNHEHLSGKKGNHIVFISFLVLPCIFISFFISTHCFNCKQRFIIQIVYIWWDKKISTVSSGAEE